MKKNNRQGIFIFLCCLLSAIIFITDLFTPLGIADGVSYTLVIILTIWIGGQRQTIYAAIGASALILLGMLLSPKGESASIFVTNRVLALISVWGLALVVAKFKKADQLAAKNRDNLNALFEYATEGIIITNSADEITMINPEAEKQFGYEKDALLNKKIEILIRDKYYIQNNKWHCEKPDEQSEGNMRGLFGKRKDNSEFPLEISSRNYYLNGELFVVIFVIDITLRKQQQDALKKAHDELKLSAHELLLTNQELENFAYISSHDLQEPLRKIQSFGDRLKSLESENFTEKGKDYLNRILNAAERMQKLINDLLSFSRLSTKAKVFSVVDLNTVLQDVVSDLEVTIEKTETKINAEELPSIVADPTQMRQLFQNLISNAIKFRKDDETPVIKIYSKPSPSSNELIDIFFEDNGIGFDEKYLDKIFTIFQRLEGQKYEGSGIGLAICRKIALFYGGNIIASSAPGKGSKFVVTLAIKQLRNKVKPTEDKTN